MSKQISNHAAAAKMIRAELKKNGIKARVRASSASMTSSVNVDILQDILPATRDAIEAFANRFQYGHFDGMTDCYEYSNNRDDLPQVRFVFVSVDYSDKTRAEAVALAEEMGYDEYDCGTVAHRILKGSSHPEFWTTRKPRA